MRKNSAEAAAEAAKRAFGSTASLPFDEQVASDPSHEGRQRLRGAFTIALSRIRPDPSQPRRTFDEGEMQNLATSLKQRGILQPIRVWWVASENVYQIISGERRFRAAQAANLEAIPCIIEDVPGQQAGLDRKVVLVDQIVENWQRADLNPYELSDALVELRDRHGYSQKEIARLTGKPDSEVSRLLSLQKVSPAIQEEARSDTSGRFTRRHLIALAQLSPDDQQVLAEQVRQERLTAVEIERQVSGHRQRGMAAPKRRTSGAIRRYATPKATVQVTFRQADVSDEDVLDVLRKVQEIVEKRQAEG